MALPDFRRLGLGLAVGLLGLAAFATWSRAPTPSPRAPRRPDGLDGIDAQVLNALQGVSTHHHRSTVSKDYGAPGARPCLCVFDIDRTLTGKQDTVNPECPRNLVIHGVDDWAYGKTGPLTLSEVGQLVKHTFCGDCFLGVISVGWGGGTPEQKELLRRFEGRERPPNVWSYHCQMQSPLVVQCLAGHKHEAIPEIQRWYREERKAHVRDEDVYFFDDYSPNVWPFNVTKYNARQISCGTRDGNVGLCGATLEEIRPFRGVHLCEGEVIA